MEQQHLDRQDTITTQKDLPRKELDKFAALIIDFLSGFQVSEPLRRFAKLQLRSIVYSTLAINFFDNLTSVVVRELQLPTGQIGRLKKEHWQVMRIARESLSGKGIFFGESQYRNFKELLEANDPGFIHLLERIEQEFSMVSIKQFWKKWDAQIDTAGETDPSMNDVLTTTLVAELVQKKHRLPSPTEVDKFARKIFTSDLIGETAKSVLQQMDEDRTDMLADQRLIRSTFESDLMDRWREPLELLECLVQIAIEAGNDKASKLLAEPDDAVDHKALALVNIHARAVHISNEILCMLRAGYADGANSRWRTLYELTIVACFLRGQPDEQSERFLDHQGMKNYKDALEYRKVYKKLNYPPYGRKEFAAVKKTHDHLVQRYGTGFKYKTGWEWVIPQVVNRNHVKSTARVNFRQLEEHTKFQIWQPFYRLSSNSIHAGANGFYRLGLIDQHELFLVGASNYGLADPLQNTAISLHQVTAFLLTYNSDFEDLVSSEIAGIFPGEIGESAVRIQNEIEEEDRELGTDGSL